MTDVMVTETTHVVVVRAAGQVQLITVGIVGPQGPPGALSGTIAGDHITGTVPESVIDPTITRDTELNTAVAAEATNRVAGDATNASAVAAEATTRAANDTTLAGLITSEASTRGSADTAEATARAAGDATNASAIAAEATTRAAADTTNASAIAQEITDRAAADASEATTRASADTTLQTNIGNEATARAAGDATNASAIAAEATTRAAADTTNAAAIAQEITDRGAAISSEAATRAGADSTEATARAAGDATNASAITTEATARAAGDTAEASARTTAIAAHEADTTAIHGIADTSLLVVTGDSRLTDARVPLPGRVTFNANAGFTMAATDRQVVNTTALTANRSQGLIAAASMPTGTRVLLKDEAGLFPYTLTWTPHAGDTIINDANRPATTLIMRDSGAVFEIVSDGVSKWRVIGHGLQRAVAFWEHPNGLMVPTSTVGPNDGGALWVPQPWNSVIVDTGSASPGRQTASTTIASASNGHVLPQATIDVASTAGFAASDYIVIPIGGVDTVVGYTGKTSTTFTGCNSTSSRIAQAGISTGTLATGQSVKGANCIWSPPTPYLHELTVQIGWAKSPTGLRGVRIRDIASGLVISQAVLPAMDFEKMMVQMTSQPGFNPDGSNDCVIEVFQDSGSVQNVVTDGLQSPLLMMFAAAGG